VCKMLISVFTAFASSFVSLYYDSSGWLKIFQHFTLYMCCLICIVYRFLLSNTSYYLHQLPHLNSEFHSSWHSFSSLSFPLHHSIKFCAAFFYTAVKFFNMLSSSIRSSLSLSSFRSANQFYQSK